MGGYIGSNNAFLTINKNDFNIVIINTKSRHYLTKTNKSEKENCIFQGNFISGLEYFGNTLLPFSSEIYLKKQTKLILQLYKNTKKFSNRKYNLELTI